MTAPVARKQGNLTTERWSPILRQGGGNERENRITLCAWHHLRGVHAGRVRASGDAPHGITWEIGVHAGRRPLIRTDAAGYY